jgi:AAA family ATP:ADP antiporter
MALPADSSLAIPQQRTALERFLCLFTDVQAGEGVTAIVMVANVFLILCSYYFVKPLRDGWIAISEIGGISSMEVKAYTSFAQGLLLIPAMSLYGGLASHWPRRDLIVRSTLFCMFILLIFWVLRPGFLADQVPGTGILFYIWVGMFGVFVVSQFWAFAADLYTRERGERLLPLIAIGATAGAVAGSFFTGALLDSGLFDSGSLLLVAALPLAASILLTTSADARNLIGEWRNPAQPAAAGSKSGALALVMRYRYLIAVAGVTLLTSWVSTNGENALFKVVQDSLAAQLVSRGVTNSIEMKAFVRDWTTAFYGSFFFWVNVSALVLQSLFASRLLKFGGFGLVLLLLPVMSLLTYTAMALVPVLLVVQVMKTAENSTAYSINNTARQVFWLPTTAEMKYKAKPAIETLFVRTGDGLAAATTLVGVHLFALTTSSYFAINVALVIIWLLLGVVVVREHRRLAEQTAHAGDRSPPPA